MFLFVIVGLSFLLATAQEKVDQKFGYKDIKLESNLETVIPKIKAKKLSGSNAINSTYKIEDLKYYKIGNNVLHDVSISFMNGKVHQINLIFKDTYGTDILSAMKELFGDPFQSNSYIDNCMWKGQSATAFYLENVAVGKGMVTIQSNKLESEFQAYKKTIDKGAASDF